MKEFGANAVANDLRTLFEVGSLGALSDGQLLDRFVARREQAVFEAIMYRHGPMVWGVCRRVLGNHHDAEDAFQAAFLVLARKASSVMIREKLGNWLYGVAYQTAMKARSARAKNRAREGQLMDMPQSGLAQDGHLDEPLSQLDRELNRLPEKYRVPIILCELEGKTHREAAEQLGWPIGTLSGRLSRGRALLARRLGRPGVTLSVGHLSALLARDAASACMPINSVVPTARVASLIATGRVLGAGLVSIEVAALIREVTKAMLLSKIKIVATALLLGITGAGVARSVLSPAMAGPGQTHGKARAGVDQAPLDSSQVAEKGAGAVDKVPGADAGVVEVPGELAIADERMAWGEVVDGLQAGVGLFGDKDAVHQVGTQVWLAVKIRNRGKVPVTLSYASQPFDDARPTVVSGAGMPSRVQMPPFALYKRRGMEQTLQPGEVWMMGRPRVVFLPAQELAGAERTDLVDPAVAVDPPVDGALPGASVKYRLSYPFLLKSHPKLVTGWLDLEVASPAK